MMKCIQSILTAVLVLLGFSFFYGVNNVCAQEIYLERPLGFVELPNKNILIADGGGIHWTNEGSQILEMTPEGEIVWQYSKGLVFAHSADLVSENEILVSDTGNNRVIILDKKKKEVIWTTDVFSNIQLNYPNNAEWTNDNTILITDRNNDRFLEITTQGRVVFEYTGLDRPHGAEKLANGFYLVSDSEGNRVLELDSSGSVRWQYGDSNTTLNWPRDIDVLPSGTFLITDSRNHRVIEVTREGEVVWKYDNDLYWPYESQRLENGNTVISDSQQKRIIEVDHKGNLIQSHERRREEKYDDHLVNSGFEKLEAFKNTAKNLVISEEIPVGWYPGVLHAEKQAELSLDTDAKSGDYAVKINNFKDTLVFWSSNIRVKPGKTYTLEGWLKKEGDGQVRYAMLWENKRGGYIDEPIFTESITPDTWQKRQIQAKAPDGAHTLHVRAFIQGEGSAWFDDVILRSNGILAQRSIFVTIGGLMLGAIVVHLIMRKKN